MNFSLFSKNTLTNELRPSGFQLGWSFFSHCPVAVNNMPPVVTVSSRWTTQSEQSREQCLHSATIHGD